jgi:hypothetical protein
LFGVDVLCVDAGGLQLQALDFDYYRLPDFELVDALFDDVNVGRALSAQGLGVFGREEVFGGVGDPNTKHLGSAPRDNAADVDSHE